MRFLRIFLSLLLVGFLGVALHAATTNLARPVPPRIPAATNSLGAIPRTPRTNTLSGTNIVRGKTGGVITNAVPMTPWNKAKAQLKHTVTNLRGTRAFYPVVIGIPVCLFLAVVFISRAYKAKQQQEAQAVSAAPLLSSRPARREGKIHACNVLQMTPDAQHLWRFEAQNGDFALDRQQTALPGEIFPPKLVAKDWRTLFQKKLNIAWLPPDQVFLRVAQFPRSDFNETLAMVELQLEKLSPIPVTQIVWTIHVLPFTQENLQTVIVLIVARDIVEEVLGRLEGQGYLADRLELPLLDQLQATPAGENGAWIYPQPGEGSSRAMVAWWSNGVLQNVDLITLPSGLQAGSLREQLFQMAWAGEMEGWLEGPPRWRLVADADALAQWEPALREALQQPIELAAPLALPELAALTATRAAHSDPRASLLPLEYSTRYQQQFVDRLWMRGLLAIGAIYLLGVAIYGVALAVATVRTKSVENQLASLGTQYTNSVQLKARYQILKDRQELKFAALECWNLVARYLPETATLDTMNFVDGRRLVVSGKSPSTQTKEIIDFEGDLRRTTSTNGELIFDSTKGEHVNYQVQGGDIRWNFSLELKRSELQ